MTGDKVWTVALEYQRKMEQEYPRTTVDIATAFAAGVKWNQKHQPVRKKPGTLTDNDIMKVLNAIGYEDESWIAFVREHMKK